MNPNVNVQNLNVGNQNFTSVETQKKPLPTPPQTKISNTGIQATVTNKNDLNGITIAKALPPIPQPKISLTADHTLDPASRQILLTSPSISKKVNEGAIKNLLHNDELKQQPHITDPSYQSVTSKTANIAKGPKPLPKHKTREGIPVIGISTGLKAQNAGSDHLIPIKHPEINSVKAVEKMNELASSKPILTTQAKSAETESYDPGKKIMEVWDNGKGETCKEEIYRFDTVEILSKSINQEKEYLEKQPKSEAVDKRIEFLNKSSEKVNQVSNKKTWASSDFFRDLIRGNPKLDASTNSSGVKGAVEEYSKIMDEEYYAVPLAVNQRSQSCEVLTNKDGIRQPSNTWLRVGVMSDMSNGFVNLKSLKQLQVYLENDSKIGATKLRNDMINDIIDKWRTSHNSGNKNAAASAGYALTQLGVDSTTLNEWGKAISEKTLKPNIQIDDHNIKDIRQAVNQTIQKRDDVIAAQFLQMVVGHFENITAKDIEGGTVKMMHVSLLNHHSKSIDGAGWNHDEENEMQDMDAIFNKFDNKKLICDGKGPFIDKDGNIHLPELKLPDNLKVPELNLKTLFVNQSVQGYTKNDGTAGEINQAAGKKLDKLVDNNELKTKMNEVINGKETGFSSATDMVELGLKAGFKVSTGCLSAKDRTGFVSASVTRRFMINGNCSTGFIANVIRDQLKETSPAVKVIIDNTKTKIMKISPFFLEGLNQDIFKDKGFADRCFIYVKQVKEILAEQQRVKQREKVNPTKTQPMDQAAAAA